MRKYNKVVEKLYAYYISTRDFPQAETVAHHEAAHVLVSLALGYPVSAIVFRHKTENEVKNVLRKVAKQKKIILEGPDSFIVDDSGLSADEVLECCCDDLYYDNYASGTAFINAMNDKGTPEEKIIECCAGYVYDTLVKAGSAKDIETGSVGDNDIINDIIKEHPELTGIKPECELKARDIIEKNRDKLEQIATELLENIGTEIQFPIE